MFLLRTKTRTGTRVPPANRKCIPLPPPFIPLGSDPILLPLFDLSRHLTYEIVLVFGTARFIIIILHGVLPPNPMVLHPNYGTEALTPDKWVLEDFVRYVWSGDTKHYFQHSERQLQDLEKLSEIKIISISNYILDICLKDIFSEFLREFILSTAI